MAVKDELATLRDLHSTLSTSAQDLLRITDDIDGSLEGTLWVGTTAERFLQTWRAIRPSLAPQLVQAMHEAQDDVRTQHNNLAAATGEVDRI